MNLNIIRSIIRNNLKHNVKVYENTSRNKNYDYQGILYKVYPRIFCIKINDIIKTYSYNEVIDGEVVLIFD